MEKLGTWRTGQVEGCSERLTRDLGRRQPLLLRLGEVQVEQLALELE